MDEPPFYCLSAGRLRELHADGIARWGGAPDVREPGCVEGLSGAALNSARYHGEEDPLVYACYLLRNAVSGNCMLDGNKRLGWYALVEVLFVCGLTVEASTEDVCGDLYARLHARRPIEEIVGWVRDRLQQIDG